MKVVFAALQLDIRIAGVGFLLAFVMSFDPGNGLSLVFFQSENSISDEVVVAIWEEHRLDDNTRRNLWIHTYSLDQTPEIENHFPEQIRSAEEILLQQEADRYREFLLGKLDEALTTLTPK